MKSQIIEWVNSEIWDEDFFCEFLRMCGLQRHTVVKLYNEFDNENWFNKWTYDKSKIPKKGWVVVEYIDDWSCAIYFEGKPVGGFYCSTRGSLQQAEAWVNGKEYYLHNMPECNGRSMNVDTWEPGKADIARNFVLRSYKRDHVHVPLTKEQALEIGSKIAPIIKKFEESGGIKKFEKLQKEVDEREKKKYLKRQAKLN